MFINGGRMAEDDPYIEHIESEEIKKLVEKIYTAIPENMIFDNVNKHDYDKIIEEIDDINIEKRSKKFGLFNK